MLITNYQKEKLGNELACQILFLLQKHNSNINFYAIHGCLAPVLTSFSSALDSINKQWEIDQKKLANDLAFRRHINEPDEKAGFDERSFDHADYTEPSSPLSNKDGESKEASKE